MRNVVESLDRQKVSVAICTYNGEKYILEQLNSIKNQTILPDEIVICDDCSTDCTIQIIEDFQKKTNICVKIYVNERQLGFQKNYQKCIGLCSGDIIFYCDQDDVWLDNKIERIMREFKNEVVLVFSDSYVTDDKLNTISDSEWGIEWNKYSTQEFFDYVQTRNFPLGHLQAFHSDMVKSIVPFLSDPDGWIAQCAPAFGDVIAIPNKLMLFRRHKGTTSNAFVNNKRTIFDRIVDLFKTRYQEFFVWPNAEIETYTRILDYIETNKRINSNSLNEHLEYLDTINNCEQRGLLYRIKMLNKLYKQGVYQKYRGNKNTLRYDKLFMCVNSLSRK